MDEINSIIYKGLDEKELRILETLFEKMTDNIERELNNEIHKKNV